MKVQLKNQYKTDFDKIEYFNKSIIQHGKYNDRVYVLKLSEEDFPDILDYIDKLTDNYSYSKIIIKSPRWAYKELIENGYEKEGLIPNFFNGNTDCYFLCKYINESRRNTNLSIKRQINEVLEKADSKKNQQYHMFSKFSDKIKKLDEEDIYNLISLYKNVFTTYPFPIFDKKFIKKTMKDSTLYYGIYIGDKIVSASSSEIDYENYNAELTDFATLKEYRGNNLSYFLLKKMECDIRKLMIKTAYTIARSLSYGMNITFSKMNYEYGGTLYNNTCISGEIENMNIYYKSL
jgi:putative beta-lysine N-acetyltransferase